MPRPTLWRKRSGSFRFSNINLRQGSNYPRGARLGIFHRGVGEHRRFLWGARTVEEYVFMYRRVSNRGKNFNEKFDTDLFYCRLGELTQDEGQMLCAELKTQAIKQGFIDRGYYDRQEPIGPVSSVAAIPFNKLDYHERPRLHGTDKELRELILDETEPQKNNPFYLLREAYKYANLLRADRRNDKDEAKMDKILGTIVHVLVKYGGFEEKAAVNLIREQEGLLPKWRERNFTAVDYIDKYSNGKSLIVDNIPQQREEKVQVILLLKAAVIATGFFQKKLTVKDQISAWGETAYRHAAKLKREMGIADNK